MCYEEESGIYSLVCRGVTRFLSQVSYPTECAHGLEILVEVVVVGYDYSAFDGRDVVADEEAEGSHVAEAADLPALNLSSGGLARVFDEKQIVFFSDPVDPI